MKLTNNGMVFYPSTCFVSKTVQQMLMKFGITVYIHNRQTNINLACISPLKLSTWHEAQLEFKSLLHSGPSYRMFTINHTKNTNVMHLILFIQFSL